MAKPRIALCHEWLTTYGGSEQCAARIAGALGIEDVFTFAARPELARALFPTQRVRVFHRGLNRTGRDHWQRLLPIMPHAWAGLDLRGFDVVVTSSHAFSNAVRVAPGAIHVSYCHTPMRYAWEWRSEMGRIPTAVRAIWPVIAGVLRRQDRRGARNVDVFIANSRFVAARIERCYGRASTVVYPPIETSYWTPVRRSPVDDDYFLAAGRLVAYKQFDAAIRAAEEAGTRLVVAGDGPELRRLQALAGPNVSFVVAPERDALRELYRHARALVNPGVEDFGMTMVEAQACGTPVIALGAGGATEAVVPDVTGRLYQHPADLPDVLRGFEPKTYDRRLIRKHAESFDALLFDEGLRKVVGQAVSRLPGATAAKDGFDGSDQDIDVEQ